MFQLNCSIPLKILKRHILSLSENFDFIHNQFSSIRLVKIKDNKRVWLSLQSKALQIKSKDYITYKEYIILVYEELSDWK
jgi:hypothetical protein